MSTFVIDERDIAKHCITPESLAGQKTSIMKKIKLGSKVKYRLRGETTLRTAAVTEIQITRNHDKMEGRIAKSCDLDKHKSVIFSLDDGHWCWEDQIRQII